VDENTAARVANLTSLEPLVGPAISEDEMQILDQASEFQSSTHNQNDFSQHPARIQQNLAHGSFEEDLWHTNSELLDLCWENTLFSQIGMLPMKDFETSGMQKDLFYPATTTNMKVEITGMNIPTQQLQQSLLSLQAHG
jgi:hypothetical protein